MSLEINNGFLCRYYDDGRSVLTIPHGVKAMGIGVFKSCRNLKKVIIPETVISVSAFAFADCTELESVEIPESVETIGMSAFDGTPF